MGHQVTGGGDSWHWRVSYTTQTGLCSDIKVNVLYAWWGKENSSQETTLYCQFSYGYSSLGTSHQVASTFILSHLTSFYIIVKNLHFLKHGLTLVA